MLVIIMTIAFVLSAAYFYVESVIYGMKKKRWLLGGIVMGPFLLPMFQISKHMAMRKAMGFNSAFMSA